MSDNRLKVLRMLSTANQSSWKVGKSSEVISAVSSKINTLPANVFSGFSINADGSKKISVVDFALMTYEMSDADRNTLMGLYNIDSETIKSILRTADEIAEIMEEQSIPLINKEKESSDDFDEI